MRQAVLALAVQLLLCDVAVALRRPKNVTKEKRHSAKDLVLMHIPYNFGHTVEVEALFPINPIKKEGVNGMSNPEANKIVLLNVTRKMVRAMRLLKPGAEVWGHLNPDLNIMSEVTGCPMYYTPPKYWPEDLAQRYFGNKTSFGMLRDPYERLVAIFRGGFAGYGGNYPQFRDNCDVNGAVKMLMKDLLTKNQFHAGCTFVPQAEYFDGPYGVKLPVDNRQFPTSMNNIFQDHGYKFHIKTDKIAHVRGCDEAWSGDFDAETRSLIKQHYARDFELLCKYFNYCDDEEKVCLPQVPYMCPPHLFKWDEKAKMFKERVRTPIA